MNLLLIVNPPKQHRQKTQKYFFFNFFAENSHLNLFSNRPQPKKKRKSRTAFTNHQIFELEKRFLYQKYLSPADRDEIAGSLGLSNAQVRQHVIDCFDVTQPNIQQSQIQAIFQNFLKKQCFFFLYSFSFPFSTRS